MELIYLILIAFPLGLVAYSTAFWGGVYRCLCFSEIMKMTIAFALFQVGMLWLGTWSGNAFANGMGWMAIPFAEAIILLTGIKLIYGAIRVRPEQKSFNLSKTGELIAVSFASSLNAFMIGLGVGLLRPLNELVLYAVLFIVAGFAVLGNYMGKRSGNLFYPKASGTIGGIIYIALAVLLALDLYQIL